MLESDKVLLNNFVSTMSHIPLSAFVPSLETSPYSKFYVMGFHVGVDDAEITLIFKISSSLFPSVEL